MPHKKQNFFINAIKGKVVIGFLFACFALLLAWGISKFVFAEMLDKVEKLSTPNTKLRIVNEISNQIAGLDQLQSDKGTNKDIKGRNFLKETREIRKRLDSLSLLYAKDSLQLARINSIKQLLIGRNKEFLNYLEVKETLVSTKSFSDKVKVLNDLLSQKSRKVDSAVFTTSTSTTLLEPQEAKSKGFLSRLFGKKEAEVYKIINEEYQIKRDTLNAVAEDSVMNDIKTSLKNIELEQKAKSSKFLKREADLANSSNTLTKQMLSIVKEVEAETLAQIELNGSEAKTVVNDGVSQIMTIIIIFFLIMLVLVYLILSDITKSNKYRKELELAKDEAEYHGKAKQRFLSNMSHEIRTPLQSILGYAELINQQDKPRKGDVDAIYKSSEHLLQIVNEILDYNRIISGEFKFENKPFDIEAVLNEVIAIMQPLAEKKEIKLVYDFDIGNHYMVLGDAFRLKQVLFNLLGNAIKFTLEGKVSLQVTCKSKEENIHYNFIVEDTGIGFKDEDLERIFTEFEQVEIPQKDEINQNGTGLGLAIVKTLVDSQHGQINVKSKLAKGTTFSVHLGYQKAVVTDEKVEAKKNSNHAAEMVWVIDDDQLILDLCGYILERHQIPHRLFNNVHDVLAAKAENNLSHILVDMRLPEMSGVELTKKLKEKLNSSISFYAMTAQVLPDEQAEILREGFEKIIIKPFKEHDLMAVFGIEEVEPKLDFDFTSLEKMTMGDEQLMKRILNRFIADCSEDIAETTLSIEEKDVAKTRLIIHRLAGRISQIGFKELGNSFRILEQEIAGKSKIDGKIRKEIDVLISKLEEFMGFLSAKIYSIP
ncbi:ATP-binding protein [Pedobacter frigiditerrae]|uniref:ATP-binding protein n=1 Tax=Pedobacter frigiditerrae TaxID=2530452 RepID=UPI00292CE40F|nr:ATP-binding protein [Pedobacter frigiditerrae]